MSKRRLLAVAAKEWIHVRRDPRSLGVALVLPIVLLMLMGEGINFDLTDLPFAVCDYDSSSASRELREALSQIELFHLVASVPNAEQGERLLQRGECLFVLVIPRGMQAGLLRGEAVALQVLLDGSDSNTASIARSYAEGALSAHSGRALREVAERLGLGEQAGLPPVTITRKVLYNPGLESQKFIVPGLIVVILVILGALLTSGTVVRERQTGTFETLAASPLLAAEILLGKLLPYVAIGLADIILAVGTGALVFGVHIAGSALLFFASGVVFLVCALSVGLLFSTVARTQQQAMLGAFLAIFLPTILLSGFIFPIRNMPWVLKALSVVVPPTHFLVIARGIYLKGVGLGVLWVPALALLGLTACIFGLAVARFRKQL